MKFVSTAAVRGGSLHCFKFTPFCTNRYNYFNVPFNYVKGFWEVSDFLRVKPNDLLDNVCLYWALVGTRPEREFMDMTRPTYIDISGHVVDIVSVTRVLMDNITTGLLHIRDFMLPLAVRTAYLLRHFINRAPLRIVPFPREFNHLSFDFSYEIGGERDYVSPFVVSVGDYFHMDLSVTTCVDAPGQMLARVRLYDNKYVTQIWNGGQGRFLRRQDFLPVDDDGFPYLVRHARIGFVAGPSVSFVEVDVPTIFDLRYLGHPPFHINKHYLGEDSAGWHQFVVEKQERYDRNFIFDDAQYDDRDYEEEELAWQAERELRQLEHDLEEIEERV